MISTAIVFTVLLSPVVIVSGAFFRAQIFGQKPTKGTKREAPSFPSLPSVKTQTPRRSA